jgi:hypothetical protein
LHIHKYIIPRLYILIKRLILNHMINLPQILLSAVFVANLAPAQALVDYQFDDDNGTKVKNDAHNAGSVSATWNYGIGRVAKGNLNYGYTKFYKFKDLDKGEGVNACRTLKFEKSLTTSDMTHYSFTIKFAGWDLSKGWDPVNDSADDKGILISLKQITGATAGVGFVTDGDGGNGFRAFSSGSSGITTVLGAQFTGQLGRVSASGGVLQINGNLDTGKWSAQAKDGGDGAQWQALGGGGGVTTISSILIAAKSPTKGSWGGAGLDATTGSTVGATVGDYMLIDSLVLTALPKPSM